MYASDSTRYNEAGDLLTDGEISAAVWPFTDRKKNTMPIGIRIQVLKMIVSTKVSTFHKRLLTRWLSTKEDITTGSNLEAAIISGVKAVYGKLITV